VRALYDHTAGGPDELSLRAGDTVELSAGPSGGKNYAGGWWEGASVCWAPPCSPGFAHTDAGIASSGKKGIFPSNYVRSPLPYLSN
jgi:hypothetical protein